MSADSLYTGAGYVPKIGRGDLPRTAPKNLGQFLRAVTPAGINGTVLAFHADNGPIGGRAYTSDTIDKAMAFIDQHQHANLYWSPNPTHSPISKKPTKSDISAMRYVHLDIDLLGDDVLDSIRKYRLRPSIIVMSGGGFHAYWALETPIKANGNIEALEAANHRVIADLGGDKATYNIDRILRLPYTTNYPNKKKVAKGRTITQSALVLWRPERTYTLDQFTEGTPDEPIEPKEPKPSPSGDAAIDVDGLPVAPKWKKLIRSGDATEYGNDRSSPPPRSSEPWALALIHFFGILFMAKYIRKECPYKLHNRPSRSRNVRHG